MENKFNQSQFDNRSMLLDQFVKWSSEAASHLLHVEESSRLQDLAQRLHQLGFVHGVHSFVDDFQQAVAGLLSELLHRQLTQQQVHKPESSTTQNCEGQSVSAQFH